MSWQFFITTLSPNMKAATHKWIRWKQHKFRPFRLILSFPLSSCVIFLLACYSLHSYRPHFLNAHVCELSLYVNSVHMWLSLASFFQHSSQCDLISTQFNRFSFHTSFIQNTKHINIAIDMFAVQID